MVQIFSVGVLPLSIGTRYFRLGHPVKHRRYSPDRLPATLLAYRLAGISLCDALGSNGRAAKEFAALTDAVEGLLP
jgi:hypothetical protein